MDFSSRHGGPAALDGVARGAGHRHGSYSCRQVTRTAGWGSEGGADSGSAAGSAPLPRSSPDNKDVSVMMSEMDVNAIAGTLKLYFRELPEPLFTDEFYPNFAEGIGERGAP